MVHRISQSIYSLGPKNLGLVHQHLKDYNYDRNDFMLAILEEMKKYDLLIGYAINEKKSKYKKDGSINGDIEMLRRNCEALAPEFKETFEKIMSNVKTLDLFPVFTSEHTKGILSAASKIKLRGDSLNAMATLYLGETKLEDLTGPEVEILPPEIQKQYCLQDAILPLKLVQKDDFKLLKIFNSMAGDSGLDFYYATNRSKTEVYWRGLLKKWGYQKVETELTRWQQMNIKRHPDTGNIKTGIKYLGGEVLIPSAVGYHLDVIGMDFASMYPTMCIVHNISPETVMCDCCKDDPKARIAYEKMSYINNGLIEMAKKRPGQGYAARPFHYWICRKQRGILPQIMGDLFKKKSSIKN
jgi:DNA polymerase elongation subunit (family B)